MTIVPMPDRSKFQGLGFAMGEVRGARTFRLYMVDGEPRLAARYYRYVWEPGVNQAVCMARLSPPYSQFPGAEEDSTGDWPIPTRGHLVDCRCGFYAYYDGSNDYYLPHATDFQLVQGVVEGWGEVLIGSNGFRCTKAHIVALELPVGTKWRDELIEHYPTASIFERFDQMMLAYPPIDGGARGEIEA